MTKKKYTKSQQNLNNMRKFNHEKIWSFEDEHVIDGMIYSNDLGKYITIEEYTDIYYGTL